MCFDVHKRCCSQRSLNISRISNKNEQGFPERFIALMHYFAQVININKRKSQIFNTSNNSADNSADIQYLKSKLSGHVESVLSSR